jgi:predicted transport protein
LRASVSAIGEIGKLIISLVDLTSNVDTKRLHLVIRVQFNDLPDSARSVGVVTALGGAVFADSKRIIEVCGSPGEILSLIITQSLIWQP